MWLLLILAGVVIAGLLFENACLADQVADLAVENTLLHSELEATTAEAPIPFSVTDAGWSL